MRITFTPARAGRSKWPESAITFDLVFTPSGRVTSIPVAVKKQHMGPHIFSPKRFLHICPVRNQVVLFLIFSVIKLLIAGQETV